MKLIQCDSSRLEAVTALYRQIVAYLERNINYPKWSSEHPSDTDIIRAIQNGVQYMAEDNGVPVGLFVLSDDPEGCYESGDWTRDLKRGEFLIIHALAVSPSCMHKGVGDFMVKECIRLAKSRGYRAIRLDVVPGNVPAVRLYEKNGFVYAGTKDLLRGYEDIPVFDLYELNL